MRVTIGGHASGGVVVPDDGLPLRDGAPAEIAVANADVNPALALEIAAWDAAGDEAWRLVDQWERDL